MPESVDRREPVEEVVDAVVVDSPSVPTGPKFDAADLALPRLRVVGKDAQLVNLNVASPGDLAIGADAEDEMSAVFPAPGGLRFYVVTWRMNNACGYDEQDGVWEDGDPTMPPCAKRQYHYTLFIPQHDRMMPVLYTANGGAAKVWRGVNTAIARVGMDKPYVQAFELTTKTCSGNPGGKGQKSWPCPVVTLTEAVEDEVKIAEALYESLVGKPRTQLGSGSTPGF